MTNNLKVILVIFIVSVFLLGGGVLLVVRENKRVEVKASAGAKVAVASVNHDWGQIGINNGKVEAAFAIKNEGTQPLKLFSITTSCMCTTAQLSLGDKVSPLFGMHSNSSDIFEVPPEQTAELKVVFDPAFHGPSGIGPINRQVTVQTNDSNKPQLDFFLTATVIR